MDIDIDFADREDILSKIDHRIAKLETGKKHNTGVYLTEIPHNPLTNLSTIDYKEAEQRGYFKVDFLNVSIYKGVKDEQHLNNLIEQEPIWDLLLVKEFTDQLFHLNGHSSILNETKPQSIEQLAAVLGMIRPAKRYLVGKPWDQVMQEVWVKPENDDYYFKKSHSISYALAIVVHMNLLCEEYLNKK